MKLAGVTLRPRFEYVQNEYNLLAANDAEALIPWCAGRGLRYTAFSPLAGGFLTGKYRLGELPPPGSRLAYAPQVCAGYSNEEAFAAIERFRQSAGERQETMAEAALRFVLDTPGLRRPDRRAAPDRAFRRLWLRAAMIEPADALPSAR